MEVAEESFVGVIKKKMFMKLLEYPSATSVVTLVAGCTKKL